MTNPDLLKFIKEARKRGFDDYQIKEPLLKRGWLAEEIDEVFYVLKSKKCSHINFKNKITIYLDNDLLKIISKRAKKNMLTLPEQIEDILRRSSLNMKRNINLAGSKVDDLLVNIFSRRKLSKK